jgi:hypothetical protein
LKEHPHVSLARLRLYVKNCTLSMSLDMYLIRNAVSLDFLIDLRIIDDHMMTASSFWIKWWHGDRSFAIYPMMTAIHSDPTMTAPLPSTRWSHDDRYTAIYPMIPWWPLPLPSTRWSHDDRSTAIYPMIPWWPLHCLLPDDPMMTAPLPSTRWSHDDRFTAIYPMIPWWSLFRHLPDDLIPIHCLRFSEIEMRIDRKKLKCRFRNAITTAI